MTEQTNSMRFNLVFQVTTSGLASNVGASIVNYSDFPGFSEAAALYQYVRPSVLQGYGVINDNQNSGTLFLVRVFDISQDSVESTGTATISQIASDPNSILLSNSSIHNQTPPIRYVHAVQRFNTANVSSSRCAQVYIGSYRALTVVTVTVRLLMMCTFTRIRLA